MRTAKEVVEGIQIIMKYEDEPDFAVEHDVIYCGDDSGNAITKMSNEDKEKMSGLRWFIDEQYDCWSIFV